MKLMPVENARAAMLAEVAPLAGETWPVRLTAVSLWPLAFQTVVITFASYLVWMWMLGRYPATRISVFVFLTPLFALLFGSLLLGEAVTSTLLASLALVAAGIVLVNRRPA